MEDPTPAELEQMDQSIKAAEICHQHYEANGHPIGLNVAGACPRCGDKLKYVVAQNNGHFSVWCDALGCIAVRE